MEDKDSNKALEKIMGAAYRLDFNEIEKLREKHNLHPAEIQKHLKTVFIQLIDDEEYIKAKELKKYYCLNVSQHIEHHARDLINNGEFSKLDELEKNHIISPHGKESLIKRVFDSYLNEEEYDRAEILTNHYGLNSLLIPDCMLHSRCLMSEGTVVELSPQESREREKALTFKILSRASQPGVRNSEF